jgi:mono/diheme cytochrome c family protein
MIKGGNLTATSWFAIACLSIGGVTTEAAAAQKKTVATSKAEVGSKQIDRGRYLAKIAGCNDCHTPGYLMSNGKVPEAQWLTGDTFGWRGPWGTTYPVNLRLYMQTLSEDEWLKKAATVETRPPMPWYVLREMTKDDLRALYRYIRHLGSAGGPAPAWVPPDKEPKPPYATFPAPPK